MLPYGSPQKDINQVKDETNPLSELISLQRALESYLVPFTCFLPQEYLGVGTTPAGSISVYKLAGKGAPVEGYLDTRTRYISSAYFSILQISFCGMLWNAFGFGSRYVHR